MLNQLKAFIKLADNLNWNFESNGEKRVLECLAPIAPKCIFDVGANEGEWSLMVRQLYPNCTVHSFEVVPSTFEALRTNTSNDPNIIQNCVGLSSEAGKITINCSSASSSVATANRIEGMSFHDEVYDATVECSVITGLQYVKDQNLKQIDFLKVDVEGMDLKVLKGFDAALECVRAIQFEYGIFNIASRDLLIDFFALLRSRRFVIGKIYPSHVDFFEYHFSREDFGGHNYVAVRENEQELISRLRGKVEINRRSSRHVSHVNAKR